MLSFLSSSLHFFSSSSPSPPSSSIPTAHEPGELLHPHGDLLHDAVHREGGGCGGRGGDDGGDGEARRVVGRSGHEGLKKHRPLGAEGVEALLWGCRHRGTTRGWLHLGYGGFFFPSLCME
ncbi:uncharacterized protein M6B38_320630 [Iris pallida]|uniref:Uncharacterized protein n=1 Tax=Iris pallida TaxID=29817 RepID=A0AAX6HCK8_IRIPA|nr:uncharacterized protein M6B38_320630 [Iris pallida]